MRSESRGERCCRFNGTGNVVLGCLVVVLLVAAPTEGRGSWEPVVGGGAATSNGFGSATNQAASAMAEFGGRLFVAVGGINTGTAFVMRSSTDGVIWDVVTDDGFGDPNNQRVLAMTVFDGFLYAGTTNQVTGAEIWRTGDGTTWDQVNTNGFGSAANQGVAAFEVFDGQLYAGIENQVVGGALYRSPNGTSWIPTAVGVPWTPGNVAVVSLKGIGTRFYAGTFRQSPMYNQPGELWWTDDFMYWHMDVAAGFGDDLNVAIPSLEAFAGYLLAGTHNLTGAEVWRWDGSQIPIQVSLPGFGDPNSIAATRMAAHLGELYVGVFNSSSGAKIYRFLDVLSWAVETSDGFGDPGNIAIGSLATFGFDLFAGTVNQTAGCEIWRLAGPLFADGFESGDTTAWSATVP